MKNIMKKSVAALAAVSLMMPLAACKKDGSSTGGTTSGGGVELTADSTWYDLTTVELSSSVNEDEFQYFKRDLVGVFNGKYIFCSTGLYEFPEGVDDSNYTDEYLYSALEVFNEDGSLASSVDVEDQLRNLSLGTHASVDWAYKAGNKIFINATAYDEEYTSSTKYQAVYDVDAGTLGEFTEANSAYTEELFDMGASEETPLTVGDYLIQTYWVSGDNCSYILVVNDPDGNQSKIDLRETMPMVNLYQLWGVIDLGDNKAMIYGSTDEGNAFVDIDLNTMTASQSSQDYSWLDAEAYSMKNVEGAGTVVSDGDGVFAINAQNQCLDEVLNYDNTNANRSHMRYLTPVSVSDEKVVLAGDIYVLNSETLTYDNKNVIEIFTKAETNPNAGKTTITVASIYGYTDDLCDAVCRFNDSSTEYFAIFDSKYDYNEYIDLSNVDSDSAFNEMLDSCLTELGNQLAIDVMSGDGPDVIIDGYRFTQLNKADYLLNLNDYVQNNLTDDKYYTNIINGCRVNGDIYQLPLAVTVKGIVTDASNLEPGQTGFTFDQYAEFVNGPCNGTDPMACGKIDFFINSLGGMMDLMKDESGNINFDNEAFRSLAEYTSNNVFDPVESDDIADSPVDGPKVMTMFGTDSYFNNMKDGSVLVGLPSYDGRGPLINVASSVAVSAQASSQEGCLAFVDTLMGADVQLNSSMNSGIPMNRESLEAACRNYADRRNSEIEDLLNDYSEAEIRSWGMSTDLADESSTDGYKDFVNNLNAGMRFNDGAINMIIREEMPAYFEGQKSLDEVITILQDRVQTVVSERG